MKVTVCFGPVKIIVPCGDGTLTVQDLVDKAIQRYRKALGKDDLYWVKVHSLQSQSDGGILDVDDLVTDVVDDREKLTAQFEEEEAGNANRSFISDGTSSIGTNSPVHLSEMHNHINNSNNKALSNGNYLPEQNGNGVDIIIDGNEAESQLQVRQIRQFSKTSSHRRNKVDSNANSLPSKNTDKENSDEEYNTIDRFSRDSSRRSLSSAHPSMFKWAEAQEKAEAGQDPTSAVPSTNPLAVSPNAREQVAIEIVNDGTPLGIHIIARVENDDGSGYGLVVHGIESGGRAAHDGRLRTEDHILSINGEDITRESFNRAQDMMRDAMRAASVKLLIERERTAASGRPASPSKVPPVVPQRSPQTTLMHPDKNGGKLMIGQTSTKRIGRKLYIQLMKGPQSLGFSITTRDNPIGGKNPIFIKNILPNGAAIADGRLKPGDRLLEVNGIEMTGKTQEEAVSILRSVRRGGVVNLVVSRQEPEEDDSFPRALPADINPDDHSNPNSKVILDFNIALNDTGSAGLGVSVKGKTTGGGPNGETKDLGIFIKSVMHGGAASKDGRLKANDQLLYINDVSLIHMSNSEAMDTLRMAMSNEKSPRSTIRLMIARRQDMTESIHNALNKADTGGQSTIDRGIDVHEGGTRVTEMVFVGGRPEQTRRGEEVQSRPPMSDQSSLLHNISQTLSAQHSLDLDPGGRVPPYESNGRAHVIYPGSTINTHTTEGMTLPRGGEDVAVIENGVLMNVQPSSPSGTTSLSPQSPLSPSPTPGLVYDWESNQDDGMLSPVLTRDQFQRDSFARLSFSERKQGGSLDAKQMAWYKQNKTKKENHELPSPMHKDVAASTSSLIRAASVDSLLDKPRQPPPSDRDQIGRHMKSSTSMDSLNDERENKRSTMDQRTSKRRLSRKQGLNDSFRSAVDKTLPTTNDSESSEVGSSPITRERKRSTKEKKKNKDKEKEKDNNVNNTGTSSKGIKGFFRFGKSRKSLSEDKSSSAVKGVEDSSKQDTERADRARDGEDEEQERIQESLLRQREESQEARHKAERMLELRQRHQNNHREKNGKYQDDDISDEEDKWKSPVNRKPSRDSEMENLDERDKRYERLSEGRSHPDHREYRERQPQYSDTRGRYYEDDYYHHHHQPPRDRGYRTEDRRHEDRRYNHPSVRSGDRRSTDDYDRDEDGFRSRDSQRRDGPVSPRDSQRRDGPVSPRDEKSERRRTKSDSQRDGKSDSPTRETEKTGGKTGSKTGDKTGSKTSSKTGSKTGDKTGDKTGSKTGDKTGDKTGSKTGGILRRSSGKGSKKEKKKQQKESKEAAESDHDDSKARKKGGDQHRESPPPPPRGRHQEDGGSQQQGRGRDQARDDHRARYPQERQKDHGYGRRNRSQERPRDRYDHHEDHHEDHRSPEDHHGPEDRGDHYTNQQHQPQYAVNGEKRREDPRQRNRWETDRHREGRPSYIDERAPRTSADPPDYGSLDRHPHKDRDSRGDQQRNPRPEYYQHDVKRAREPLPAQKHYPNGGPAYHQGYGSHTIGGASQPSSHQRSRSYGAGEPGGRYYDQRGRGAPHDDRYASPSSPARHPKAIQDERPRYHNQPDAARV